MALPGRRFRLEGARREQRRRHVLHVRHDGATRRASSTRTARTSCTR
jgi:hypothetical protein